MMHTITRTVTDGQLVIVACTCGFRQIVSTGIDATRIENTHARKNQPSVILKEEKKPEIHFHRVRKG
jgi:hypothetical protein